MLLQIFGLRDSLFFKLDFINRTFGNLPKVLTLIKVVNGNLKEKMYDYIYSYYSFLSDSSCYNRHAKKEIQ